MIIFAQGPLVVTEADPIVESCFIFSAGSGIMGNNVDGIKLINCTILYSGGQSGILLEGCRTPLIQNCRLVCADNALPGQGKNNGSNAINLANCDGAIINRVRTKDAACGAYIQESKNVLINAFQAIDSRGPMARGQGVQFNGCDGGALQNFDIYNDLSTCWTEDCVNIFNSTNMTVKNGFIDGNNSPSGAGVMWEQSTGICSDVDVVNWCNGAFGVSNSIGVQFVRCRASRLYTPCSQGRGTPGSGGLVFAAIGTSSGIIFDTCQTFGVGAGGLIYDSGKCVKTDITTLAADFIDPKAYAQKLAAMPMGFL